MCNFGGSSTNTNQIIRGQRDPNRKRLRPLVDDPIYDEEMITKPDKSKPKNKSKLTTSDTYQG